ncbi:MAG TPA: hypothetical protein VKF59_12275 [Candidatus Dormibacteraeota bacterium]|nr:hypothetical protein [Candidatus Dormibacteraeota bacterium]
MLLSLALLLIAGPLVAAAWVAWWLIADMVTGQPPATRGPTGPRGALRELRPFQPHADVAATFCGDLRERS